MFRAVLRWLRERIAVEDPDDRIEGSGEVILDPAYNARYEGERDLQRMADMEAEDGAAGSASSSDSSRERR